MRVHRYLSAALAMLRKVSLYAAVGGLAALGGGFLGRLTEGPVAAWIVASKPAAPPQLVPASVVFVVETSVDAASEVRGLAAGIAGFREELARLGGAARLGLVLAGDAAPRAATFADGPFTEDVAAFRRQLEEGDAAGAGRAQVDAGLEAAAALLATAEGRRCLVVVARDMAAGDLSAAVPALESAGVSGVSVAVAGSGMAALEPIRRRFSGATVPLGDDESARRNFELAVPALAAGLVAAPASWLPSPAKLWAAAPAATSGACLAALTMVGLLAARRWLVGGRVGWRQWSGAPVAAAILGAMLALAAVAARPAVPHAEPLAAAVLGGGLAWLASGARTWRQAGLATGLAAMAAGGAVALTTTFLPAMPWPAAALALGAPVGATLGAISARPVLRMRLPGGRTLEAHVGLTLTAADLPGLTPAAGRGAVAEIVANPSRPGVVGLKNLSQQPWTLITPEGRRATVAPTKSAGLQPGTRIDFGRVRCEFV